MRGGGANGLIGLFPEEKNLFCGFPYEVSPLHSAPVIVTLDDINFELKFEFSDRVGRKKTSYKNCMFSVTQ